MKAPKLLAGAVPEWAALLESVTVDDMVRTQSCRGGVVDWMRRRRLRITAVTPAERLHVASCGGGSADAYALDRFDIASHQRGHGHGRYGCVGPDGRGSGNAAKELFFCFPERYGVHNADGGNGEFLWMPHHACVGVVSEYGDRYDGRVWVDRIEGNGDPWGFCQ
jgi:hypothetical protein